MPLLSSLSRKAPVRPTSSWLMLRPSGAMCSYSVSMSSTPAARPASVRIGPGRQRIDADPVRSHVIGQVAHGGFEGRFADPHHVVAGHTFFAAEVGHRGDGPARIHDRFGGGGAGKQRVDADIHRQLEAVAAGVDRFASQVIAVGKGNRVQQEVDFPERFGRLLENCAAMSSSFWASMGTRNFAFSYLSVSWATRRRFRFRSSSSRSGK